MNRRKAAGFVLLEAIVAMTIVGIGFAVLFSGMSQSTRNIQKLETFQHRELLVRNLLSKLRLVQQLRPGDTVRGTLEDGTRWRFEVHPFVTSPNSSANILRIELRLEWEGKSGVQTRTIETYRLNRNSFAETRTLENELHALD